MLINHDASIELYLIGNENGISVKEIFDWIKLETQNVVVITKKDIPFLKKHSQCMICMWTLEDRKQIIDLCRPYTLSWPSFVHPSASVAPTVRLGKGAIFMPLAYAGYNVRIGDHVIVGQFCSLGHGCSLGNNVVASPGTTIGGSTSIGDNVYFSQRSNIKDQITICSDTFFQLGSTVSKNIDVPGIYFGNRQRSIDNF
jgi:UDP-3-O-[3-hydroxymyristoyl] glucosamine N-acyltransferase